MTHKTPIPHRGSKHQNTMNIASAFVIGGVALLQFGGFVPVQAGNCDVDFTGTCTAPEILDEDAWCDACTEADCCERREKRNA